ncbi:unnamed protein product [Rangifer tarandus platyrhynchus]|uniref:Uncharacterized protein n=1 Tax=Rangifer tarandus platyrhynchus TaxID=3082113 RepID=A0AC59Z777_RANTA
MVLTQLHCMAMELRTLAGLIALPPAHQATAGMRVRGRSAEGGLRVPDSRTAVWWRPWCARWSARCRDLPRGGGVSRLGGGAGGGRGPRPLLASDTSASQEGYPPGGGGTQGHPSLAALV